MKNYLLTDTMAGLALLAIIVIGGYYWMDYKTNQIVQELEAARLSGTPAEVVKRGLRSEAEKTLFARAVKRTE